MANIIMAKDTKQNQQKEKAYRSTSTTNWAQASKSLCHNGVSQAGLNSSSNKLWQHVWVSSAEKLIRDSRLSFTGSCSHFWLITYWNSRLPEAKLSSSVNHIICTVNTQWDILIIHRTFHISVGAYLTVKFADVSWESTLVAGLFNSFLYTHCFLFPTCNSLDLFPVCLNLCVYLLIIIFLIITTTFFFIPRW